MAQPLVCSAHPRLKNAGATLTMASSPVCVECSTPPATGSLKRCSQCQVALYCCTKCQKAHWPTHKLFCIPPTRHVDFRVASSWDEDEGPSPSYIACPPLPGFETTYREGEWSKLLDADDKIVAPGGYLKVLYEYPFGTAGPSSKERRLRGWVYTERSEEGFTRGEALAAICRRYTAMYEEEESVSQPNWAGRGMLLNRPPTQRKYAIWGHEIGDLTINDMTFDEKEKVWILSINS